jgi:excinuclease ABC subunit B
MELAVASDPLARQSELERAAAEMNDAKLSLPVPQNPLTRPHKPSLDEMGPHNREIPLAGLKKGRGRSKAGKPGTRACKGKSR